MYYIYILRYHLCESDVKPDQTIYINHKYYRPETSYVSTQRNSQGIGLYHESFTPRNYHGIGLYHESFTPRKSQGIGLYHESFTPRNSQGCKGIN